MSIVLYCDESLHPPLKVHASFLRFCHLMITQFVPFIFFLSQLTSEKERSVARLVEERERAERDQSAALAEAVKGQATLRAEMAAILQRAKVCVVYLAMKCNVCYMI